MEINAVIAIIRTEMLDRVETCLQQIGLEGISISRVKGYGEYENFYSKDHMTTYVRLEIFTSESKAENIARCIIGAAHSGLPDDGIVSILPVHKFYRIHTHVDQGSENTGKSETP
ncbi:MAG: P-II family nitrogen regulator [Mariprofundaceae bacterium]|nr:P-II family nitrogen regulator [Mariprofundaceae bacterium]